MSRTLIIIKPDGVERGLVGDVVRRFEARGLRLAAAQLRTIDDETARRHYAEHEAKEFFGRLVDFITRGPSLVMVVEGPADTWRVVRIMVGPTDPRDAAPGTIRGDLATEMSENVIHASDSEESSRREIAIFFPDLP